ncbi:serine protease inhibitor dipetalogastin-like [Dendronephthya gigantea]|uniref:serine protease inhibitor dipetalogastin-like n=1 Tax=Dendronephthya gigantea TaxID=151771 RepID=UPI00106B68CF|nr:serine protease inhibitor dipetalogastin-like [Dendronephthya gigantea]
MAFYLVSSPVHAKSREPKCRNYCTLEYNPQCGTDGKTYGNPCFLIAALCVSDGKVRLAHHGECKPKPEPTCAVACPRIRLPPVCGSDGNTYPNYCILEETACQFKQNITIVHEGLCKPKCQAGCPKNYDPQCGTDGKTYGNPCMLKYAQCESDGKIRLAHHGECEPKCRPYCPLPWSPQCGTDGKTYSNPCFLKAALCESDGKVRLAHHGECGPNPEPTCAVACPRIRLPPVCGSDGNTYPNYCILEETACQFKQNITIVHEGPCEPKCRPYCPLPWSPQCGTDGKTYSNPCFLKSALCESDGKVRLAHHGECGPNPEPTCVVPCPRIRLPPVCGSDGNTYPNYCILEETACQFKQNITIMHKGPCSE